MWVQSRVLFVTLNIPGGSNNDDKWYDATKSGTQVQEVAQRTAADLRWLDSAFAAAQTYGVSAVVIVGAGGMRDLDRKDPHRKLRSVHRQNRK